MRFRLDPFSPTGVSVANDAVKVIQNSNGYVGTGVREIIAGSNVTVDATNPERPVVSASGGGGGGTDTWGAIVGNLPDQTDLQSALDSKQAHADNLDTVAGGQIGDGNTWPTAIYLPINLPVRGTNSGGSNPSLLKGASDDYTEVGSAGAGIKMVANDTTTLLAEFADAGGLDMQSFRITGLADPSLAQDAATKAYVDTTTAPTTYAVGRVDHASDSTVARPGGYYSIIWVGSVLPDNITTVDQWIDMS